VSGRAARAALLAVRPRPCQRYGAQAMMQLLWRQLVSDLI